MTGKGRGRPRKLASTSPATHGNTGNQPQRTAVVNPSTGVQQVESLKLVTEEIEENPKSAREEVCTIVDESTSKEAELKDTIPRKLWTDVITRNRNPSNGLQLNFVAPQIIDGAVEVEIGEEDVISKLLYW